MKASPEWEIGGSGEKFDILAVKMVQADHQEQLSDGSSLKEQG